MNGEDGNLKRRRIENAEDTKREKRIDEKLYVLPTDLTRFIHKYMDLLPLVDTFVPTNTHARVINLSIEDLPNFRINETEHGTIVNINRNDTFVVINFNYQKNLCRLTNGEDAYTNIPPIFDWFNGYPDNYWSDLDLDLDLEEIYWYDTNKLTKCIVNVEQDTHGRIFLRMKNMQRQIIMVDTILDLGQVIRALKRIKIHSAKVPSYILIRSAQVWSIRLESFFMSISMDNGLCIYKLEYDDDKVTGPILQQQNMTITLNKLFQEYEDGMLFSTVKMLKKKKSTKKKSTKKKNQRKKTIKINPY